MMTESSAQSSFREQHGMVLQSLMQLETAMLAAPSELGRHYFQMARTHLKEAAVDLALERDRNLTRSGSLRQVLIAQTLELARVFIALARNEIGANPSSTEDSNLIMKHLDRLFAHE